MAESTAVIRLNATDDGATSTIQKVGAASDAAAGSSENLKKQLRELQKELSTLDPNSQKFQELSLRAGQVKDQINDASEAIRANAGSAFEGLSNNAGLLTDRLLNLDFEGVASAARGLGANIGRIDFKSLSAGVQQAGTAFVDLGKSLLTNPIFLIGAAIAAAIIYWDELSVAIGINSEESARNARLQGELSEELASQSQKVGVQTAQINALFDAIMNQNLAEAERLQALDDLQTLYPDVFANQDIDINNTTALTAAKQQLIATIQAEAKANAARALLEKKYAEQFEVQAKLQRELKNNQQLLNSEFEGSKFFTEGLVSGFNELIEVGQKYGAASDIVGVNEELLALNQDILDLENLTQETLLKGAKNEATQIREKNKTKVRTNRETNNRVAEDTKKAEEKLAADIAAIQEEQRLAQLSKDEVELIQSQKKYDALVIQAKGNAEALAQIEELRAAEELAIRTRQFEARQAQEQKNADDLQKAADDALKKSIEDQKVNDQLLLDNMAEGLDKELALRAAKYDADIAAAEGNAEAQKLITEKYVKDVQDIEAKAQEESLKKRLENIQTWGNLTAEAFGAISELDQAFRKEDEKNSRAAFNRNKAYSIAQAIIQTGLAVTAALTAGGNPIKLAKGQNFVEAGIAAAVGLAQVATIAKTQYNAGGTSGGGGGGSTSFPSASAAGGGGGGGVAQFNPLNTNFVNNRPGQVSQTYVLAGDVANAQEARNRVQDLARL